MTKQGVVTPGKTPSCISGKPSELIKSGEALTRDEAEEPLLSMDELEEALDDGPEVVNLP